MVELRSGSHWRATGAHRCDRYTCDRISSPVSLVCKQLYEEAVPAAWKSSTFSFLRSADLQYLLHAPGAVSLDLVRLISMEIDIVSYYAKAPYLTAWKRVHKSPYMEKLESLREFNLAFIAHYSRAYGDVKSRPALDGFESLPALIRQFRTFPLEEAHNSRFIDSRKDRPIYKRGPSVSRQNFLYIRKGYRVSIEKAKSRLGYESVVDTEEGIRRTVAWFKKPSPRKAK
ncbi:hypothetical protein K458DRAFT_421489 [Lentithecium fluviatile CBS 122367]|uniref:Uncharacterized protein n=1 Tax=Lentithecium fluviatile CBS 122367 TaxID=1168545 RepID=A0A6G1IPW8_9PLEO|nr:hypothetical protein K458DRAFT_421489 [Lentithecium fluviatile CBS 122367]